MGHQESTLIKVLFGNALTHSDSLNFNVTNDCFGSNTETKIRFLDFILECSVLTLLSLVTFYMDLEVFLEQSGCVGHFIWHVCNPVLVNIMRTSPAG